MLKQASYISLSRFVEKVFSFLIIIVITNLMAPSEIGRFFFYFSLISLLIPLMDMGFEKIFVRHWSQSTEEDRQVFLGHLIFTKICFACCTLAIAQLVDVLLLGDKSSSYAVLCCFIAVFSNELGTLLRGPDHARERYRYEIIVPVICRLCCVTCIFFMRDYLLSIEDVLLCYAVFNFAGTLLSMKALGNCRPLFNRGFSRRQMMAIVKEGLPYSLTSVFVMFSFFVDSVILGMYSLEETAFYNCSFRIIIVFSILSSGLSHVIFSRYSQLAAHQKFSEISSHLQKYLPFVVVFFGSILLGVMAVSPQAIEFLYGEKFSSSAIILTILAPFILLSALSNLFAHTLEACGAAFKVMRFNMITATFNLVANLIFIPIWGMYGAAVTTLLTELANMLLSYHALTSRGIKPFSRVPRRALAILLIMFCVALPASQLELFPALLLGSVIFIILIKPYFIELKAKGEELCA
ncbi:MAG: oligosaccharide flippase family protein [Lentisphaeraceae bacterium]|nr:oligosaccharide flippase family protein [Lentisphaeraceae bacterium]